MDASLRASVVLRFHKLGSALYAWAYLRGSWLFAAQIERSPVIYVLATA